MLRNILFLTAILSQTVCSQPLELRIHSIDAGALPQIRLKVAVTRGGQALTQPGRALFSLLDNGLPMQLTVNCPDSAVMNNVALVLDNSGSLSGIAFDSLKAGAHSVVDSLRDNDATAIYHFSNGGERVQDFTTDKTILHDAVSALRLGANTPLYNTIDMALRDLASRPGRKYCIVFTDGLDNASDISWTHFIPFAQAAGIRIYIIGFGNTELSDDILSTIARETGARYWRIYAPGLISSILRGIAEEIVSPYCTISYEASGCADSLRIINLAAMLDGQIAATDSVFVSPFRADTLYARVTAPDRILPGGRALVYIALQPGLHTGLQLSFSALLRYDPALLGVTSLVPVTVGTITQNTTARIRQLRPGVLQFSADYVSPAMASGNLIGAQLRHTAADSSRAVIVSLDSLTLIAGCPTTVLLIPDTIDVCQCEENFVYVIDEVFPIMSGQMVSAPLRIPLPPTDIPVVLRARLHWDASLLRFTDIDDASGDGWDASIDHSSGRALLSLYTRKRSPELLPLLRFIGEAGRTPQHARVQVDSMTLYADCCYDAGADSTLFWIDGRCEFLLRRKSVATIQAIFPNPASEMMYVVVSGGSGHTPDAVLEMYDSGGQRLRSVDLTHLIQDNIIALDVYGLPAGRYTVRLSTASSISARTVVVVR